MRLKLSVADSNIPNAERTDLKISSQIRLITAQYIQPRPAIQLSNKP